MRPKKTTIELLIILSSKKLNGNQAGLCWSGKEFPETKPEIVEVNGLPLQNGVKTVSSFAIVFLIQSGLDLK